MGVAADALASSSDASLKELGSRLGEVAAVLSDVSAELGSFVADLPDDVDELERMLQRQQELKTLTRKYAPDIAGVIAWRKKAAKRLSKIDTSAEAVEELRSKVSALEQDMAARAATLTKARVAAAKELGRRSPPSCRAWRCPRRA